MRFYRSQFWRLQKLEHHSCYKLSSFIGHNFGDYKNQALMVQYYPLVLSVTILETTKTSVPLVTAPTLFYRSQFWRLQKPQHGNEYAMESFIGHNFGDYKNKMESHFLRRFVLSVTILETTKTLLSVCFYILRFYRSQFWRLQKPDVGLSLCNSCFIGHNFGDYKNKMESHFLRRFVLSVTILETTKTQ